LEGPWGERLFCSHEAHGGNGRFFTPAQVEAAPAAGKEPIVARTKKPVEAAVAVESAKVSKPTREPKPCTCGCGGMTKGGRFLPGHDARYHSALKKMLEQNPAATEAAGDGDA